MGCHKQRAKRCEQSYKRRVFRRPSTRGRRNPAVCNPVRNAERRCRSNHGTGDGKWAQGGWRIDWKTAAVARARATRYSTEVWLKNRLKRRVSNRRSGRGLRGGWFLLRQGYGGQWSSISLLLRGAMRGGWFVPFLSGAGVRAFQRQRVSPAPPRHIARIVPVFVPSKPLARRRGVLGLLSRLYNGSTTTTRAEGLVRYSSQLGG